MCSTCVDRIFTSGPASCPVPSCGKTLRKKGFHKAFFDDLKIEREVDVRRRVGKVFNRRADEFESLRDWNDYLEQVEDMVFNIMEGSKGEKAKAEQRLLAFAEQNKAEIEDNRRAAEELAAMGVELEQAEKAAHQARRLAAVRAQKEEKEDVVKSQRDMLNRLAHEDGDAMAIAEETQKRIVLKKASLRRNLAEAGGQSETLGVDELTIRGLKKKIKREEEKPYDPWGGYNPKPTRYVLQDEYTNEKYKLATLDLPHTVGGYSFKEYNQRAVFEAMAGLAIFIEDEMADKPPPDTAVLSEPVPKKIKIKVKKESDDIF